MTDSNELVETAMDDLELTKQQLAERWSEPFNYIQDVFLVRDSVGDLYPPEPYPYIRDFIHDGFYHLNTDRVVLKSRQIGFSTAMELEAIQTCLTFPEVEVSMISAKFDLSKKLILKCGQLINEARYPLPVDKREIQKQRITFDNGSRIVPYSSNPDSVRSENIIKAFLDEFAFFPQQEELLAAVEPKVSRGGSIAITSTPLSNDDEFMSRFKDAYYGEQSEDLAYYCPLYTPGTVDENVSLYDQPHLEPICSDIELKRVENVRRKSPERFLQEYMCIPIDDSTAYYPRNLIMSCIDESGLLHQMREEAQQRRRRGTVTIGVDIALQRDETAIQVVYELQGTHYLIHFQTTRDEYRQQLKLIDNLVKQFRPSRIRSDATGTMGIQLERDLWDRYGWIVEGVTYSNPVKQDMAVTLKMYMQNTYNGFSPNIYIPNDTELINQLHGIKIDVTEAGNYRFSGKGEGGLDDMVNALWLALPPDRYEQMTEPATKNPRAEELGEDTTFNIHNKHKNRTPASTNTDDNETTEGLFFTSTSGTGVSGKVRPNRGNIRSIRRR